MGCVVVAGGSGSRLGAAVPKAFVRLGALRLIDHAVQRLSVSGSVSHAVLVLPEARLDGFMLEASAGDLQVLTVSGGATRQASVARGLAALPAGVDVVLVHDAARCLTPPALFSRVGEAVRSGHPAVVPVLPVADTIRTVTGDLVDRSGLRAVQTPQGFDRALLSRAHAAAEADREDESLAATDDAGLVQRLGHGVHLVDGEQMAFKITTAFDLQVAEGLVAAAQPCVGG